MKGKQRTIINESTNDFCLLTMSVPYFFSNKTTPRQDQVMIYVTQDNVFLKSIWFEKSGIWHNLLKKDFEVSIKILVGFDWKNGRYWPFIMDIIWLEWKCVLYVLFVCWYNFCLFTIDLFDFNLIFISNSVSFYLKNIT